MGRKSKSHLANQRNGKLNTPQKDEQHSEHLDIDNDDEHVDVGNDIGSIRQNLANALCENEELKKELGLLKKESSRQIDTFNKFESIQKELEVEKKKTIVLRSTVESLSIDLRESRKKEEKMAKTVNNLKLKYHEMKEDSPIPTKVRRLFSDVSTTACRDKRCQQLLDQLEEKEGKDNVDDFLNHFIHFVSKHEMLKFKLSLSAEETAYCRMKYKWSDGFMKDFKSFCMSQLGFDILASRGSTDELLKKADAKGKYHIELVEVKRKVNNRMVNEIAPVITIKDLKGHLESRLSILSKYGNLLEGDIVVGIGGDKGGDTTKLCLIIENVSHPNNPQGIMLLGQYTGQDNHKNMKEHFSDVFSQINALKYVEFTDSSGSKKCLPVKKKAIGDCIFMCSLQNHGGPTSSNPCFICDYKYSTHGANKELVGTSDFNVCHTVRTLDELKQKGDPLLELEPSDYGIPPIHTFHGVVQKFAVDPLIAMANKLDLGSLPTNLSQQREHLKDLKNQEESSFARYEDYRKELALIEDLSSAFTKMESTRKTTRTTSSNCASSCCIVKWCKKKMMKKNETHSCATCGKLFHLICSNIISSDDRLRVLNGITKFNCFQCELGSVPVVRNHITKLENNSVALRKMMEESEVEYCTWHFERTEAEKQLKLSNGQYRKTLEKTFREIGCDHRIWYQEMTGNQIRKLLRPPHIRKLVCIFPDSPEIRMIHDMLLELSFMMSHSDNAFKTDAEIDEIEKSVLKFTTLVRKLHPNTGVTLKLHLLTAHLVDHLRAHRSWGKVSEQGIESLHAVINGLNRTYASVHDPKLKAVLILQYLINLNFVFDMGNSWIKEN